jgi:hypothetical protein
MNKKDYALCIESHAKIFVALCVVILFLSNTALARDRELQFPGETIFQSSDCCLHDSFFPIGWAKKGTIAYAIIPADQACGCHFFEVYIQDLVTDTILWKYSDPREYPGGYVETLKAAWQNNLTTILSKLHEYKIIQKDIFRLRLFPVRHQNDSLDVHLKNVRNEACVGHEITKVTLKLVSNLKGEKVVADEDFSCEELGADQPYNPGPQKVVVDGYFKSPFENRIAIICRYLWRGWEGPPPVYKVKLVGADLEKRFKAHAGSTDRSTNCRP